MAWASLDDDDAWDDDYQTPHTPVHHIVQREDDSHRELVDGRMEASRGSPGLRTGYQVDVGEEEAMLQTINPTWRTTCWLKLVVQGISDDGVPWYELVIPLMVGTEGAALSLAKHLLAVWRWSIKVLGQDVCPPALTALNIGQFMTKEEVSEDIDEPLWFMAYSRALQWVGEAARRCKWEWPVGKTPEVRVSPLVHAFWEETGIDLATACVKLCWEPTPSQGNILKEGEGSCSLCHYLCRQASHTGAKPGCLGSIHLATSCSHAVGPHGGGAVWLSSQSSCRPQAGNAGGAVKGDG